MDNTRTTNTNARSQARTTARNAVINWQTRLKATEQSLTAVGILHVVVGLGLGFYLMSINRGYDFDGSIHPYIGLGFGVIAGGVVMAVLFISLAHIAGYLSYKAGQEVES